mmetsp:Transcript_46537/g.120096  ORF Transcript_46537/g.120096 Transcript_46537/m.120096 type:complete len:219 (-) Transcript_46537:175-831(-)|eukprot:CAMPEP_0113915802 /NCGR_PEP_ID=MMETSP0780_2-20120614/31543_1 /TAXON_ID=652834 /ORGANISM="Palpitomonas bilix" /LENGTH=218 /DNA_ID=CAMNT_0000914629 /DNA_START=80 /DNA_END=736 /DNA_ORIENTATION=- /assembly_acc=CAM_ASM_000599
MAAASEQSPILAGDVVRNIFGTEINAESVFKVIDENKDGVVSWEEFEKALKTELMKSLKKRVKNAHAAAVVNATAALKGLFSNAVEGSFAKGTVESVVSAAVKSADFMKGLNEFASDADFLASLKEEGKREVASVEEAFAAIKHPLQHFVAKFFEKELKELMKFEFKKLEGDFQATFKRIDANGDGVLSVDEFKVLFNEVCGGSDGGLVRTTSAEIVA